MPRTIVQPAAVILLVVVGLTGCAEMQGNKGTVGALGGGAMGGLIAAAAGGGGAAIAGAVIGGALLGGAAGTLLDQRDRQLAAQAQQRALEVTPTGTPVAWTNPDSGHQGTVTPVRTFQQADGRYCREFQNEVIIGGQPERGFGTACRMPDGSWQIQG